MERIGELLSRDLGQQIEEIIKLDQTDEHAVYTELTEYIATDKIKEQYRGLFKAIAEAPTEPNEGVGVWVSGFFGSGKSSFAKNLGYVLSNPNVKEKRAAELFKGQLRDERSAEFIDLINVKIPTEVIMFDVSVDRAVRRASERIAEVMYTVLLRELDYAEDYDLADLEIELEAESKLEEFQSLCLEHFKLDWKTVRKGAQKISRASAILQQLDGKTYPNADSWSQSLRDRTGDISIGKFVERAFELVARRRPGKALVFIIDEVGQYVSRSAEKIEDLRGVVEEFGRVGKNLVKSRKAPAPVWIVVTSQEKLDEVVAAIDSKRVELAKLQDRFKHRVDLAPADIREVATKRVLAKKEVAEPVLAKLFKKWQGQLNIACRLERTARKSEITEKEFVQFYPYLPYHVELSIDIVSGIRLQPGAPRHVGGSNRTIIKQAWEMLVSDRTALAKKPIGTLVTLDKIYELVEGNLSSEKQKDISDVIQTFKADTQDKGMTARVAKTIALLEFVRDLPRTETNIAACLVDKVSEPAPLGEVPVALKKLQEAQFIRNTEQGWKLQTAQEKNWDIERRGYLEPRPKERNEIVREAVRAIFDEPKLKIHRFRDVKSFRAGITINGIPVGEEGQLPLSLFTAEDAAGFAPKLNDIRVESRQDAHKNDIYWVCALTSEIDDLVANVHASRQMISKYEQLRAQNQITNIEMACLANEKNEVSGLQNRLRDKLLLTLEAGQGVFRGVAKDGSGLGSSFPEVMRAFFDSIIPDLYPKLEMGVRQVSGREAEEVLRSTNLGALSQVFYEGPTGLGLIVKDGAKFVPNPSAPVAAEILNYIKKEHSYGNKVTGKDIDHHFEGVGYAWERDLLRLVLAVLLRAGAVEVTSQGRRFRNHQDPQCRVPFASNLSFRSASFAPRESIDLKTLTTAVRYYEELTGEEVDVEESAISSALKRFAETELSLLLPSVATARANELAVLEALETHRQTLEGIVAAASDDCVRILAGEGKSLKDSTESARKIREALSDSNLKMLRQAKVAANDLWPALVNRPEGLTLAKTAKSLSAVLGSPTFYERLKDIAAWAGTIRQDYRALYLQRHQARGSDSKEQVGAYDKAIDEIKGHREWSKIPLELGKDILAPLTMRVCGTPDVPEYAVVCQKCVATLSQMDSDMAALPGFKAQALARIYEFLAAVDEKKGARVERVKVLEFFNLALDTEASVNEAIERLREHLQKLVAEGAKIIVE